MLDFQQKRKIRGVMYSRVTLALLFVLVVLMLHSTWNVYRKMSESREMKNISLQNVEQLRERSDELGQKIERLSTRTGVEEEIRSKFSVAKNEENMVIIVEEEANASSTSSKKGMWATFLSFFD